MNHRYLKIERLSSKTATLEVAVLNTIQESSFPKIRTGKRIMQKCLTEK